MQSTVNVNPEAKRGCPHGAGIGRTGTFCAVDIALQRLCSRDYGVAVSAAELKPIIAELRRQRAGMVQTAEQYLFCYQARSRGCTPGSWRNAGAENIMIAASAAALCRNLWQDVSKPDGSSVPSTIALSRVKVALQAVRDEVDLELQGR